MHSKIVEHFKKNDPILHSFLQKVELDEILLSKNLFVHLCESIISQQLSVKASDTIFGRFKDLFPNQNITPEKVLSFDDEELRRVGMSYAKINSIKDLSTKILNKILQLEELTDLTNDQIIEKLIIVKGIGKWTAEMTLIFALGRGDVFSFGDLALKKGIQKMYKLKTIPTEKQMQRIVKKWSPYKSIASRVAWKVLELKD